MLVLRFSDWQFFGRQKADCHFSFTIRLLYAHMRGRTIKSTDGNPHSSSPSSLPFTLSEHLSRECSQKNTCDGERNRERKEVIDAILSIPFPFFCLPLIRLHSLSVAFKEWFG